METFPGAWISAGKYFPNQNAKTKRQLRGCPQALLRNKPSVAAGLALPLSQAAGRGPGDLPNSAQVFQAGEARLDGSLVTLCPETTGSALCCPGRCLPCRGSMAGAHSLSPSSTHSLTHATAPGAPGALRGGADNPGREALMSPAWTSQFSTRPRTCTQKNPTTGRVQRCSLPPVPSPQQRFQRARDGPVALEAAVGLPAPRLTSNRGS